MKHINLALSFRVSPHHIIELLSWQSIVNAVQRILILARNLYCLDKSQRWFLKKNVLH